MAKTGKQIEGDIYTLLRDSDLTKIISGDIYRRGMRPRDSEMEDAIVIFTSGLPGQIEEGIVTINIYVPDIDPFDNGIFVEDGKRTEELEVWAQEWVDKLTADRTCYIFSLSSTIATFEESEITQHFISIKLRYRYFGQEPKKIIPSEITIAPLSVFLFPSNNNMADVNVYADDNIKWNAH